MEIIGRVSKGSKMDQVYIPKNRGGIAIGNYVIIKPLEEKNHIEKFYFYGIKDIEPIKFRMVKEVMRIVDKNLGTYDNIVVTGSFLDKGFHFNDMDIILVVETEINANRIKKDILEEIGIKPHILILSNKSLIKGLEVDPLYRMIFSKYISKNRFVYKIKPKLDYKLLDLHLLKSKVLINNFDFLNGSEKYNAVRNMIAIWLYIKRQKINKEIVDHEIKINFDLENIDKLKQNMVGKKTFLKKYKLIYHKIFLKILRGIENDTK